MTPQEQAQINASFRECYTTQLNMQERLCNSAARIVELEGALRERDEQIAKLTKPKAKKPSEKVVPIRDGQSPT